MLLLVRVRSISDGGGVSIDGGGLPPVGLIATESMEKGAALADGEIR